MKRKDEIDDEFDEIEEPIANGQFAKATHSPIQTGEKEIGLDDDEPDDFLDDFGDDFDSRPIPMEKHADLLKGLTDFSVHIRKLYNNWLGISWDEDLGKYVKNSAAVPVMNAVGANWNVSFIETYVRGNNILANLNIEEYMGINMDINRTLLLTYAKKYHAFGFNCYSDVIRVWNEVENAALLALSGTGAGKYSDFLGGGTGVMSARYGQQPGMPQMGMPNQYPNYPMQQRKPGLLGNFRRWFSGGKQ